eukprot:3741474-Amphidinium_carterae.1
MAADNDEVQHQIYVLTEQHVEYMTHIQGDTEDDDIRLRQIQDLEDDIQSIDDQEYYDKRRQEELDDPEGTFWRRSRLEGNQHKMDEAYCGEQTRDRQLHRDERQRGRFEVTMEDLARMRDALRDFIITGRRQRLQQVQDAQCRVPKAPPAGIRQPYHQKALQDMTLQELRDK